jgi:hypothetical protein
VVPAWAAKLYRVGLFRAAKAAPARPGVTPEMDGLLVPLFCPKLFVFRLAAMHIMHVSVLGNSEAPYTSRRHLVHRAKNSQYSLSLFSSGADGEMRTEKVVDQKNFFERSEDFCNLNCCRCQENANTPNLLLDAKFGTRFSAAPITTDCRLCSSAPFVGDDIFLMSEFLRAQGRRLELRGGCDRKIGEVKCD